VIEDDVAADGSAAREKGPVLRPIRQNGDR
jgi:hypothetical protein